MSPYVILIVLALLFAVFSMVWHNFPLLPVSVLLVCVALLIGRV